MPLLSSPRNPSISFPWRDCVSGRPWWDKWLIDLGKQSLGSGCLLLFLKVLLLCLTFPTFVKRWTSPHLCIIMDEFWRMFGGWTANWKSSHWSYVWEIHTKVHLVFVLLKVFNVRVSGLGERNTWAFVWWLPDITDGIGSHVPVAGRTYSSCTMSPAGSVAEACS